LQSLMRALAIACADVWPTASALADDKPAAEAEPAAAAAQGRGRQGRCAGCGRRRCQGRSRRSRRGGGRRRPSRTRATPPG
jgi:hypothetical protein